MELLSRTGSSAGLRADHPLHAALTEGYGHVALEAAADLDATFERLVAEGATVVREPRPAPVPGARMAWVKDPEGNLLELLHRG
ncbi:MAG TPA: VOC family protein [Actinomycetes bacterium]|nr:VOC family protein [Actinomycetes bacterium]